MAQIFNVPLDNDNALSQQITDISNALLALQSSFSGTGEPALPVGGQLFWDTDAKVMSVFNATAAAFFPLADVLEGHKLVVFADSPYAPVTADRVLYCDTSGGNIIIELPSTTSTPQRHLVIAKKTGDANSVTINPDGSDEIGDGTVKTVKILTHEGEGFGLQSAGTAQYWAIVSQVLNGERATIMGGLEAVIPSGGGIRFMKISDVTMTTTIGFEMPRNGSIVSVSIQFDATNHSVSGPARIELHKNGSNIHVFDGPTVTGNARFGSTLKQARHVDGFAAGDQISFAVKVGPAATFDMDDTIMLLELIFDD